MKILTSLVSLLLALPMLAQKPNPSDTTSFRAEEVCYWNHTDSVKLTGTLTIPNDPTRKRFPALVIISGSGPEDRDGISPAIKTGPRVYKALAEYLSARGFAVLRFDDRGVGGSSAGKNAEKVTTKNTALDGLAGVIFLRAHPAIDSRRVGVAGHSEGGDAAAMVAADDREVAFVLSLAGAGVDGGKVLIQQNYDLMRSFKFDSTLTDTYVQTLYTPWIEQIREGSDTAVMRKTIRASIQQLETKLTVQELKQLRLDSINRKSVISQLVTIANLEWIRYFITHDPATDWQRVKCPVLALNGSRDVQVNPQQNLTAIEVAVKKGGNLNVKTEQLSGLNHMFQRAKDGTVAEYFTLKEDFAPEALQLIANWLKESIR